MQHDARLEQALDRCRSVFPEWRGLVAADFVCDDPKGFSSFTVGIHAKHGVDPPAVLYRGLEGKDNAILDFETEKGVFLLLGDHRIAPRCYYYDETCRIEEFYEGRTLSAGDLADSSVLAGIAAELYRFHQIRPEGLPERGFFELLHDKWGRLGQAVLQDQRHLFPPDEQAMCDDLQEMYTESAAAKVQECLPSGLLVFCHNDTYHGNVMMLRGGDIKLLDFEFSCLNHLAYDFSNLFAETVMRHGQPQAPYFRIGRPTYTPDDIATLVGHYLERSPVTGSVERSELDRLTTEPESLILLSHYMYAMAAIPLAAEPVQKLRFIPYAHARWLAFLDAYNKRFA